MLLRKRSFRVVLRRFSSSLDISSQGVPQFQRQEIISGLYEACKGSMENFLGYQGTVNENYAIVAKYLNTRLNNVGDPFCLGYSQLNTKEVETEVLKYYSDLWQAKLDPEDPTACWGYVLSMGSTEGNIFSLYNAREYLGGKPLLLKTASPIQEDNYKEPVILFSQETHYSILKACSLIKLSTMSEVGNKFYKDECPLGEKWPLSVPSYECGGINVEALCIVAEFFASKGHPLVLNFNLGTTFKGACDQIRRASESVLKVLKKHNMLESGQRNKYWIHIDGALGASYIPYIEKAIDQDLIKEPPDFPFFDFRENYVHSIVTSGHKWIGAPWPCGVLMMRNELRVNPVSEPSYIGTKDTTFAGSRNAISPLILWEFHSKYSEQQKVEMACEGIKLASYLKQKLEDLESRLGYCIYVRHSPLSLAVRFLRPCESILKKYSLCVEKETVSGQEMEFTHVFCMRHVSYGLLDQLCSDLVSHENPFPAYCGSNIYIN